MATHLANTPEVLRPCIDQDEKVRSLLSCFLVSVTVPELLLFEKGLNGRFCDGLNKGFFSSPNFQY